MLALDANILVRGALGKRVRRILDAYIGRVEFVLADVTLEEARFHIRRVLLQGGSNPNDGLAFLDGLLEFIDVVFVQEYQILEFEAKQRIAARDITDWPTVAVALMHGCPIWTEDPDFFGCGIATWTSDRVEIFLRSLAS